MLNFVEGIIFYYLGVNSLSSKLPLSTSFIYFYIGKQLRLLFNLETDLSLPLSYSVDVFYFSLLN